MEQKLGRVCLCRDYRGIIHFEFLNNNYSIQTYTPISYSVCFKIFLEKAPYSSIRETLCFS